jgi:Hint domain
VGQTINVTPSTASTTTPQLSNTTFDADTTINVIGSGVQNILAWFDNTFQGAVNIGDAMSSGRLELTPLHQPAGLPPALATNAGVISIAGDSAFHIAPFLFTTAPGPFFDGVANFDNEGQVLVAQGGELVESESSLLDLGPYPWTFTNNGSISVQGGGNQSTLAVLETNLAGNGTILLDGGASTDPVWTQLRITGNIGGGAFRLSDASIAIGDVLGSTVNTGGSITFEDGNSFALLDPAFDPFEMPITGFRAGDTIALAHQSSGFFGSTYSYNWDQPTHQLTIFETPTFLSTFEIARLTLNGVYDPSDFTLIDNTGLPMIPGAVSINSNGTFTTPFQLDIITSQAIPCFVRGTLIATPDGKRPVENLRPGKQVITLADGEEVPRTVTWVGHRRIDLTRHLRPETVAPIRIERDAFADDMPHRDLLVSPDHAIFVDGKLICARQLVNGTTIRQECDSRAVHYYHVELDRHAILVAEGLPAESYLDTGNSGFFANSGAPLVLHPDLTDETDYPTREVGSCAPFVSDAASVQPVWQRLADRAAAIGRPVPTRVTTTDAALRVFANQRMVKPVVSDSERVIFVLPRGTGEVRLLSRAQSPTEARPWLEDRRQLGVRVKRIVLRGADDVREVPVDHPALTRGWWAVERDGQMISRWTDGEAVLPLPAMSGIVMLEIHLAGSMIYVVEAAPEVGLTEAA